MRNLVGIEDLSREEIDGLISVAMDIYDNRDKYSEKCKGIIMEIFSVADNIEKYFEQTGIREKTYTELMKVINDNRIKSNLRF